MDKKLVAILVASCCFATVAITHNVMADESTCAMKLSEAKVEDEVCAAWIEGDNVVIGPLSDVDGQHIIGSSD